MGGAGIELVTGSNGISDSATSGTTTINCNIGYTDTQTWTIGNGGHLVVNGTTRMFGANRTLSVNSGTVTLNAFTTDSTRTPGFAGTGTLILPNAVAAPLTGEVSVGTLTLLMGNKAALGTGLLTLNGGSLGPLVWISPAQMR